MAQQIRRIELVEAFAPDRLHLVHLVLELTNNPNGRSIAVPFAVPRRTLASTPRAPASVNASPPCSTDHRQPPCPLPTARRQRFPLLPTLNPIHPHTHTPRKVARVLSLTSTHSLINWGLRGVSGLLRIHSPRHRAVATPLHSPPPPPPTTTPPTSPT